MDGTGKHHVKQNKPDSDKYYKFSLIYGIQILKICVLKKHRHTLTLTYKRGGAGRKGTMEGFNATKQDSNQGKKKGNNTFSHMQNLYLNI